LGCWSSGSCVSMRAGAAGTHLRQRARVGLSPARCHWKRIASCCGRTGAARARSATSYHTSMASSCCSSCAAWARSGASWPPSKSTTTPPSETWRTGWRSRSQRYRDFFVSSDAWRREIATVGHREGCLALAAEHETSGRRYQANAALGSCAVSRSGAAGSRDDGRRNVPDHADAQHHLDPGGAAWSAAPRVPRGVVPPAPTGSPGASSARGCSRCRR